MRTKQELLERLPEAAKGLADQWRSLRKFALRLAGEISGMSRGGQRGFLHNLKILEHWVRLALLQLAEHVELAPRKRRRKPDTKPVSPPAEHGAERKPPRPGFRAILPDTYDLEMRARQKTAPAFDISAFCGASAPRRDARLRYRKKLAAIAGALSQPGMYARRVRRTLDARKQRPPIKHMRFEQQSALPDLLRVSRHSDLGRQIWYNDSS